MRHKHLERLFVKWLFLRIRPIWSISSGCAMSTAYSCRNLLRSLNHWTKWSGKEARIIGTTSLRYRKFLRRPERLVFWTPYTLITQTGTGVHDWHRRAVLCHWGRNFATTRKGNTGYVVQASFWSKTLTDTEQNYSITEEDGTSVVWAIRILHLYNEGTRFRVRSDHDDLWWIMSLHDTHGRFMRRSLLLAAHDFSIHYNTGFKIESPDALSSCIEENRKYNEAHE